MRNANAECNFVQDAGCLGNWGATLGAIMETLAEDIEDSGDCSMEGAWQRNDVEDRASEGAANRDCVSEDREMAHCSGDEEEKVSRAFGAKFVVQLQKLERGALGLSLVEQDDAVIVERIYSGLVQQWNVSCNRNAAIQVGDVLSAVNGFCGIDSIMTQCQGLGPVVLDVIRGPVKVRQLASAADVAQPSSEASELVRAADFDLEQLAAEQQRQLERQLREAQQLEDKKRLNECGGQQDLQKLLADRLAMSRRSQS